jgi:hypothetical protein
MLSVGSLSFFLLPDNNDKTAGGRDQNETETFANLLRAERQSHSQSHRSRTASRTAADQQSIESSKTIDLQPSLINSTDRFDSVIIGCRLDDS